MAELRRITRRNLLRASGLVGASLGGIAILAACGETKIVEVTKVVPGETKIEVVEVVKEVPVEKIVTVIVEAKAPVMAAATVSFWKPPHGPEAELWPPLFEIFNADHPNITIDHKVIPWGSVTEQFTAAFGAGAGPDIFYLPDEWYPPFAAAGQLMDLTPTHKGSSGDYVEAIWNAGHYQGKLWGIPFLAVSQSFIVHMELLEANGITDLPTSWAEIREVANKIHDPQGAGSYGIDLSSWRTFTVPSLAIGGAGIFTEDLTGIASNTPGGVAAWEAVFQALGAAEDDVAIPLGFTDDQKWDLRLNSNVGFSWTEASQIKRYRLDAGDIKLAAIPLPAVEGTPGKASTWANAGYNFVGANTKEPEATMVLFDWLNSKFIQEEFVVKGIGNIPTLLGIDIPSLIDQDPVVVGMLDLLNTGVGTQISAHWDEAMEALGQEAEAAISGLKTAEQALADFEALIGPNLDGS